MLTFSENDQEWQPVPSWVEFLIRLGYRWHSGVLEQRRVALVSMPCDSAAAGLIALGALIRDLERPDTNDVDEHYNALLRYARQYLESCSVCTSRCHPEKKRCGYTAEATGWVRHWGRKSCKRYKISAKTDLVERRLWYSRKDVTWWQDPKYATDWQIDGEPPPQLTNHEGALAGEAYVRLIDSAQIIPVNLRRSYSGLCFAGRVGGETATRNACASVCFRFDDSEFRLPNLLAVHGWSPAGSVSRMSFFNSRTERFDRHAYAPSLVVADGDKSFLKIIGRSEFQRSDIIVVIHRIMEREHLEAVGNRIHGLRQWYTDDPETIGRLHSMPRGVGVMILRRRTT